MSKLRNNDKLIGNFLPQIALSSTAPNRVHVWSKRNQFWTSWHIASSQTLDLHSGVPISLEPVSSRTILSSGSFSEVPLFLGCFLFTLTKSRSSRIFLIPRIGEATSVESWYQSMSCCRVSHSIWLLENSDQLSKKIKLTRNNIIISYQTLFILKHNTVRE